jgi:hypothetical protein
MGKNIVVKAFKTYHVVPSQVILNCSFPVYAAQVWQQCDPDVG